MCSMKLSTNTAHLISEKGTSLFLPPNSDCESCTRISAFHQTIINNARWSFRLLASGNNSRQKPCSWTVELGEWAAGGPEAAQGSITSGTAPSGSRGCQHITWPGWPLQLWSSAAARTTSLYGQDLIFFFSSFFLKTTLDLKRQSWKVMTRIASLTLLYLVWMCLMYRIVTDYVCKQL